MKTTLLAIVAAAFAALSGPALAHHSFAVYDMTKNIEFKGTVDTLKFRNPHSSMTLIHTKADGTKETIDFVETAPANMLVRMGLTPAMIKPGTEITAIGAPRRDDPNAFFLKAVVLPNGKRIQILGPP